MHTVNPLSVGPIVGHVNESQARIWGRAEFESTASGASRRAFGIARIRKQNARNFSSPRIFKMNPNFDMTGIACFADLSPNTEYDYEIGWFFSDKELDEFRSEGAYDWHNADRGVFKTAHNDKNAKREFAFGSCRYLLRLFGGSIFDNRGDKTFRSIVEQIDKGRGIDKFLMLGDQIYADDLSFVSNDKRVDAYLSRYRDAFSQPYIKELMSRVSTYMTLDDHEIEDNWPEKASKKDLVLKYPSAMHAYQIYQMSHSPALSFKNNGKIEGDLDQFYYTFQDGCCDFFCIRHTHRTRT